MTRCSSLVMRLFSIEPRKYVNTRKRKYVKRYKRKYVKRYEFLLFEGKYKKDLLDTELDSLKTAAKKVSIKQVNF